MINKTMTGTSKPVEIQYKISDIKFIVIDNLKSYLFYYCFTLFSLFLFRMFHQRSPRIPPASAMTMTPVNAFQSISLTPAAEVFRWLWQQFPKRLPGHWLGKIVRGAVLFRQQIEQYKSAARDGCQDKGCIAPCYRLKWSTRKSKDEIYQPAE